MTTSTETSLTYSDIVRCFKSFDFKEHFSSPVSESTQVYRENFKNISLPNKKNEKWKYSELKDYLLPFDLHEQKAHEYAWTSTPWALNIVFVNGELKHVDSSEDKVAVCALNDESTKTIETIKKSQSSSLLDEWPMAMLEAHGQNQYLIEIKKSSLIHIHHFYSDKYASHHGTHLHILANSHTESHIIESYESKGSKNLFINNASSILTQVNARLFHTQLQNLEQNARFINNNRSALKRDAVYKNIYLNLGAEFSRNNQTSLLLEQNADTTISGLSDLDQYQHFDTNSFIHHLAPNTYSHQLYKNVVRDKAHSIFTGLIRVDKNSQLIESEQLNKNLLLSPKAHAHSRPQLEIFADDVKCAHGSTTGQISEEELFYFNARGIPREQGEKILSRAFSNDVILKIENKNIRKLCQKTLEQNVHS